MGGRSSTTRYEAGTARGNDHLNIETLKAGEDTISKTLAKLYTKGLSERRIPTGWNNAKMMLILKKENKKDLKDYIPICLLSNIYDVRTNVLTKVQNQAVLTGEALEHA